MGKFRFVSVGIAGCGLATILMSGSVAAAAGSWDISTVIGNGSQGNNISGSDASFAFPGQVSVDSNGNVLVADRFGQKIRVIADKTGTFYGQAMTAGDLYDIAGNGTVGYGGNEIPAVEPSIGYPEGVTVDSAGNVLFSDTSSDVIQVVAGSTGTFYGQSMVAGDVYVIAGDGTGGYTGDGGPATSAELNDPAQVSLDAHGNVLIADQYNNVIRVVAESTATFYGQSMTKGYIYTVAGDGTAGYSGDGGPATSAMLDLPQSVVTDASGNLIISDNDNYRVRVVAKSTGRFYGIAMTAGYIYTVAGDGTAGYSGDGGPSTSAELFNQYGGVSVDPSGNIVITDSNNFRVRVIAKSTGTFYGQSMTAHHIYTVAGDGTAGDTGNGASATSAELAYTDSSVTDSSGNLVIDDGENVRVIATSTGTFYGQSMTAGYIYQIAGDNTEGYGGDGGPATSAELNAPAGVAVGPDDGIIFTDENNDRVRMEAGETGTFYGTAMTAGDVYTIAGTGTAGYTGVGGLATDADLYTPIGVAVDAHHNVVFADVYDDAVQVIADKTGTYYGQSMKKGYLYTVAGDGTFGYSGIGGKATSATIGCNGVAIDSKGNIVITDFGNERIYVVAASDGSYYGESMTAGDIYLIAGTGAIGAPTNGAKAKKADLDEPNLVTVDSHGNVVFADSESNTIEVIPVSTGTFYGISMKAEHIYTVAGTGTIGSSGDGGAATSAELNHPDGVALDSLGNLVIADSHNQLVRVVAESTGTFYGISMTSGDIYAVAGDGTHGYSGDGGPAVSAELANPLGVATLSTGNSGGDDLYITESGNSRVRVVAPQAQS
jgi:trimeric autotransporter adhesin